MRFHPLPEPEASYLRRFFEGVDRAVSAEMEAGRSLLEENLCFVLCRLLDGGSTFQRILEYSLDRLNADLQGCGTGQRLEIEFETNEHKRSFEAAVSRADLGIVFRRDAGPDHPAITKALLVQGKKLYAARGEYVLNSSYEAFDIPQYEGLKAFANSQDWRAVYYFMFNPITGAFGQSDQDTLKAIESILCSAPTGFGAIQFWHPDIEYMMHRALRRGLIPVVTASGPAEPEAMLKDRLVAVSGRPGLRVLSLRSVSQIVEDEKTVRRSFSLRDCYRNALSEEPWHADATVPFVPLATFMVDMLAACFAGSTQPAVLQVARGEKPSVGKPSGADVPEVPTIAARHTLRVTLRSTLPEGSHLFPQ